MLVVNIHENHIGWWEHRAGLPCTWPIYVLSEAPWTWLNAKIPTLFDQEKSHGMRLSFFQYSEEHTKTFFPAPSYWGWNLRLFIPLLWNSYVHYCSGDPGTSLSVPRLHSPPCHKMPCVQALLPPLCWDGAVHLSQSYSGSLTPPAFCKISMSLIWYYHILPSTVPSTVYFMKVFPKVWINAEHWANEQLMAHKLHESSLILRWDLRS